MTIRQQIMVLLAEGPYRAKEISQALGIPEKEVADHLHHIGRTLGHRRGELGIEPATCLSCGYVFRKRRRLKKPGRCPKCKEEQIREQQDLISER